MDITYLKGVGPKRAELYKKLGIETVEQLVELYPRDYIDFTDVKAVNRTEPGEQCAIRAAVTSKKSPFNEYARTALYKADLSDGTGKITAVFFNTKYSFEKLEIGQEYIFYGKIGGDLVHRQILSPLFVSAGEKGAVSEIPAHCGTYEQYDKRERKDRAYFSKAPRRPATGHTRTL